MDNTTKPTILVATDFSPTAEVALAWAVELAAQHGAEIELLHAVTFPPSVPDLAPTPGPEFLAQVEEAARTRLEETAARLRGQGVTVGSHLALGTPSRVIVDRAAAIRALLIVLGTRGLTGWRHLLLGSTAERVVQGAATPVLAVHPGDQSRHRPVRAILVPTDFSADAERAIETARRLLAPIESGARLILLHAYNLPVEYTAYGPVPTSLRYLEDSGLDAERRLFELSQKIEQAGLAVETVAREGDPAQVVVDEAAAREVDLIAMGTRGLSGLKHLLLGSTADRVVQLAHCPVLTVRRPPADG
jgi:nucleotide-binding universal stress UspA family protein